MTLSSLLLLLCSLMLIGYCVPKGKVQLIGGLTEDTGLIQIYYNNEWLPLTNDDCTDDDSMMTANVICNQLGYDTVASVYRHQLCYPAHASVSVVCDSGQEVSLLQCEVSYVANSTGTTVVGCGVTCADSLSVRISNSSNLLMMYYEKEWTPVCADPITEHEVTVICRELGYQYGLSDQTPTEYFTNINNTIAVYLPVNCTGHEFSLKKCPQEDKIEIINDCNFYSTIKCYDIPQTPCNPLLSSSTCNSVTLYSPHSLLHYIQYNQYNVTTSYTELLVNNTWVTITGLDPLTAYQFTSIQYNDYGNSTPSDPLTVITKSPVLPELLMLTVSDINITQVTVSWEILIDENVTCTSNTLYNVIIKLNNSFIRYDTRLNFMSNNNTLLITSLQPSTNYQLSIVPVIFVNGNISVEGPASETIYFTTARAVNETDNNFAQNLLSNSTFSLILLVILGSLISLIVVILLMCCTCAITRNCYYKKKRQRQMNSRNLYYEDSINVYTTGDLSDQSYIPMTVSSSQNSTVQLINTRRRTSSTVDRPTDSYWINLPTHSEVTSTFTPIQEDDQHSIDPSLRAELGSTRCHTEDERDGEEESDHSYDIIPVTFIDAMTSCNTSKDKINESQDDDDSTTIGEEEEERKEKEELEEEDGEEKVYEEIPSPLLTPVYHSSQDDIDLLPPRQLTLSQEPNEMIANCIGFLPPPKEFADLPPQRSATISCDSKIKRESTHHRRHRSFDNEDPGVTKKTSRNRSYHKTISHSSSLHKRKGYSSRSTPRLDVIINPYTPQAYRHSNSDEERETYYNIPTSSFTMTTNVTTTTSKDSLLTTDSEAPPSEYETLISPRLIKVAPPTSKRPKRPPPPVPANRPRRASRTNVQTSNNK